MKIPAFLHQSYSYVGSWKDSIWISSW